MCLEAGWLRMAQIRPIINFNLKEQESDNCIIRGIALDQWWFNIIMNQLRIQKYNNKNADRRITCG